MYTMVAVLLVIDLLILIPWAIVDPLQRDVEQFPLEEPTNVDDDIKIRPELEHCRSHNHNVWMGSSNFSHSNFPSIGKEILMSPVNAI